MIPLTRPLLPPYAKLAPYLQKIDTNRYYTNRGPLCLEYERRISEHFNAHVASSSSATSALTACLLALDLPPGSKIATPSWSFIATAAAIVGAGHIPYFVDVDPDSWCMGVYPYTAAAILLVSPFGLPIDRKGFANFEIPIIIDAAAGFDTAEASNIPTVISTHATKAFSTAEGGFLMCKDEDFVARVRDIMNLGISPDRSINVCGINAKMSEYHAAIGLAELDGWPEKREKWIQIQGWYGAKDPIAISTRVVKFLPPSSLTSRIYSGYGIATRRRWYGIHDLPAYKNFSRESLPVTEDLIDTTLGLPCFLDITKEEIDRIVRVMA